MSYFIFNGIDSRQFGITSKLALPPLPERTIKTAEIPGRYEPLNRLDVMRKNTQLTLTISMPDVSKISEVNAWLQGKGDLILSDDLNKKYHAYVNMSVIPERLSRRFGNIPIVFTVEPFRYSLSNPYVSTPMGMDDSALTGTMTVINNGTCDSEPLLYFSAAGKLRVTVNGSTEPLIITTSGEYTDEYTAAESGGTAKYHYKYKQQNIYVDAAARVAYTRPSDSSKIAVVNQTSGRYPAFQPGENTILFELVLEEWEHDGKLYTSNFPENQKLKYFGYQKNERWY